jgi:hypothetical protein
MVNQSTTKKMYLLVRVCDPKRVLLFLSAVVSFRVADAHERV